MPSTLDLTRELDIAQTAARRAAAIQVDRYERLERIVHKSEKDVVTEVDHLSEEVILETIGAAFPDDAFIAEESGPSGKPADRVWVIDPLDGTVNYANGIPFFAVSIALMVDGRAVLGVVLDPVRGELFAAAEGAGATLDGREIRHPAKDRLVDSVVHLGLPRTGFVQRNEEIRHAVRITRAMGSATLALTYVANGRFDAYIQWSGLSIWDIAAAGVIAIEAGATVTSSSGGKWLELTMPGKSIGIIASAPVHHPTYLEMIARSESPA